MGKSLHNLNPQDVRTLSTPPSDDASQQDGRHQENFPTQPLPQPFPPDDLSISSSDSLIEEEKALDDGSQASKSQDDQGNNEDEHNDLPSDPENVDLSDNDADQSSVGSNKPGQSFHERIPMKPLEPSKSSSPCDDDEDDIMSLEDLQPDSPINPSTPQPIHPLKEIFDDAEELETNLSQRRSQRALRQPTWYTDTWVNRVHHEFHYDQYDTRLHRNADLLYDAIIATAVDPIYPDSPHGMDPSPFLPEPSRSSDLFNLPAHILKYWVQSFSKELRGLFLVEQAFDKNVQLPAGASVLPVKDVYKVKISSDGTIDKLKVRIAIRGDLDQDAIGENNWAPAITFIILKLFLAEAARLGLPVYQVDFVSAYLQSLMDRPVYVMFPAKWKDIMPEFSKWFGRPLLMVKSVYGVSNAGRLWAEELYGWLVNDFGFVPSKVNPGILFFDCPKTGDFILLACYIDDLVYAPSSTAVREIFERAVSKRFNCSLLGYVHWFLQSRIQRLKDKSYIIDQSRYAASVAHRFLPQFSVENPTEDDVMTYASPLPSNAIFTKKDASNDKASIKALEKHYGYKFPVAVGSVMWLINTYPRINYAVRKLAKFMSNPGKIHFEYMNHLLHHLRCHRLTGIKYYHRIEDAPIYRTLQATGYNKYLELFTFIDSSWQDCPDTSKSTGAYIVYYRGGVIDCASVVPEPVAMSSAKAEYNTAAIGTMATTPCRQMVLEMRNQDPDLPFTTPVFCDSTSAMAMGVSYRDTRRTRHILRRYHYVRYQIDGGWCELFWVPTDLQLADALSKPLPPTSATYQELRKASEVSVSV